MRRGLLAVACVCLPVLFMTTQAPSQTADPAGPRWLFQGPDDPTNVAPLFVEIIIAGGLEALTRKGHDQTASRDAFRTLFRNFFATDEIGEIVLGRLWLDAPNEQRARFLEALGGYLANILMTSIPKGRFIVRDASLTGSTRSGATRAEVITVFVGENFSARVPWIVAVIDGELKVLDITFAGTSFLLDHKGKFDRILRRNGGSLDGLISEIRR